MSVVTTSHEPPSRESSCYQAWILRGQRIQALRGLLFIRKLAKLRAGPVLHAAGFYDVLCRVQELVQDGTPPFDAELGALRLLGRSMSANRSPCCPGNTDDKRISAHVICTAVCLYIHRTCTYMCVCAYLYTFVYNVDIHTRKHVRALCRKVHVYVTAHLHRTAP